MGYSSRGRKELDMTERLHFKMGKSALAAIDRAEAWPRGATARPRSGSCLGARGPREATPRSRSGGLMVRRYPSSKVRSSGCTLLEQQ